MSQAGSVKRISIPEISRRKGGTPLVALTAYTAPIAKLVDPHCDIILVGDSLGMVIYGMDSTLPVTLDMMILHGQAVVRSTAHAAVVIDLPFGSYQESPAQAFATAARVLADTGAEAVKLEGGSEMAETIAFLAMRGVPVMAHIGLTPQSVNILGGYGTRGKAEAEGPAHHRRCKGRRRSGRVLRRDRRDGRRHRPPGKPVDRRADDRHRRIVFLRRADIGDRRHAGHHRARAAFRAQIRQSARGYRQGGRGLCR